MKQICQFQLDGPSEGALLLTMSGDWTVGGVYPDAAIIQEALSVGPAVQHLGFNADGIAGWDTSLLAFLLKVKALCAERGTQFDAGGLPDGVRRLLALAVAVPERKGARRQSVHKTFLVRIGEEAQAFSASIVEITMFIGEAFIAFKDTAMGRGRFRRSDLIAVIQETGAQALPIVSLISLLVGLILAFVSAMQLKMFGAQIYVANLVGIAMVRVMGAIMTGIIMAGRTGAAFAAQLGTMQVNEEIDALRTMGISPMDFLVLPRMLALALMMPLLCVYADLMGVLGGMIVGVGLLDLSVMEYFAQTKAAIGLQHFWIGLFHSAVFGVLVAVSGCMRGMQCGRSASAVGEAATSAVVTGIVSIIVATAMITVVCNVLGI
jgi:phospholipid/cholesterol/gamma-HCH transport system permease protein